MKHRILALILALACAALPLAGCATAPSADSSAPAASSGPAPVTFTDAMNRTVTVTGTPQRAAALIGSFADVWCLAGGTDTLAATADDTWTQFSLDLPDTVVNLGGTTEPNLEALLSVKPDGCV